MPTLLQPRDELERRISTSYPAPLAHGYRSLVRAGDPRDLYREQLRVAENILAFLASVSLALLKGEDRDKESLELVKKWSGGISPGHWRDITQRCSKVFAGYGGAPLPNAIRRLKIGSQQKGFGGDVDGLIGAKNAYKHDRGPTGLEKIMDASDGAQEMLRRCMEALAFLADYPLVQAESPDAGSSLSEVSLNLGGGDRVSLYPFVVSATCPDCGVDETYFVDAWDTRRGTARLKSFERGHSWDSAEVAEALTRWG